MVRKSKSSKNSERVMVVLRSEVFSSGTWHGLKTDNLSKLLKIISANHKFLPRDQVEEDPRWQQIIPYLVFETGGKVFVMKRRGDHTDKRLASMYSLGVGGHT